MSLLSFRRSDRRGDFGSAFGKIFAPNYRRRRAGPKKGKMAGSPYNGDLFARDQCHGLLPSFHQFSEGKDHSIGFSFPALLEQMRSLEIAQIPPSAWFALLQRTTDGKDGKTSWGGLQSKT